MVEKRDNLKTQLAEMEPESKIHNAMASLIEQYDLSLAE